MHPYLQELKALLFAVQGYKPSIEWISRLGISCQSIAHFGCSYGYEWFALSILLNAHDIVGVDRDEGAIENARGQLAQVNDIAGRIRHGLGVGYFRDLSDDALLELDHFAAACDNYDAASFVVEDMIRETTLPSNHFDLAYCERVLYHIACDKGEDANDKVLSAIKEMARVIKPTGHIIAIEPQTCSDGSLVDLRPFFELTGLIRVEIPESISLPENKAVYFYRHNQ